MRCVIIRFVVMEGVMELKDVDLFLSKKEKQIDKKMFYQNSKFYFRLLGFSLLITILAFALTSIFESNFDTVAISIIQGFTLISITGCLFKFKEIIKEYEKGAFIFEDILSWYLYSTFIGIFILAFTSVFSILSVDFVISFFGVTFSKESLFLIPCFVAFFVSVIYFAWQCFTLYKLLIIKNI